MTDTLTGLIYLMIGASLIYLFQVRRKRLGELTPQDFPYLDESTFNELKILLKTAYERILYLGVLFVPLAMSSFGGANNVSRLFFLVLIILLFLSNIPPRNRIMRLLEENNISYGDLKKQGIRL